MMGDAAERDADGTLFIIIYYIQSTDSTNSILIMQMMSKQYHEKEKHSRSNIRRFLQVFDGIRFGLLAPKAKLEQRFPAKHEKGHGADKGVTQLC
jgi:hypothetical protein